ncbi:MAG: TIGR00730 family Rossman fold protein [Myxococcales bacterium]|nr:TIGR00730 family Rossman fold protein [Myxococcales bacterium]
MELEGAAIAVFCGSSPGHHPSFMALAAALGEAIARRGASVVYGGASVGLMGAVADAALTAGGRVVGVIPESLRNRELAHTGLSALHVTPDMHTRKARMAAMAAAFIALPGGYGTWEEVLEIATWRQIGLHHRPIVLVNHRGYYDPLVAQIETAAREGFMSETLRSFLFAATTVDEALGYLAGYTEPANERAKFA